MDRRPSSSTDARGSARSVRRGRRRGIATLEALVVISFMTIFLFLMPYTYRLFAAWYSIQAGTRAAAMEGTIRGCTGVAATAQPLDYNGSEGLGAVTGTSANQGGDATSLSASMNTMTNATSTTVRVGPLRGTVQASSFGMCSEIPRGGTIQGAVTNGFEQHQGANL